MRSITRWIKRGRGGAASWTLRLAGGTALAALQVVAAVPVVAQVASAPLACDLSGYRQHPDLTARVSGDVLAVEWEGAGSERVSLRLTIRDGTPVIDELALRAGEGTAWVPLATDARIEYSIVEGLRRISNQQLAPLRDLGVELT